MILIENETLLAESGTPLLEGDFLPCSADEEFETAKIYQFNYSVATLPLLIIKAIRRAIVETFLSLKMRFSGMECIAWELTNQRFIFQAIRKREEVAGLASKIALSTVAIACSGAFLIAGLVIIFSGVSKLTTTIEEEKTPIWIIAGIFTVCGLAGYLLGRKK